MRQERWRESRYFDLPRRYRRFVAAVAAFVLLVIGFWFVSSWVASNARYKVVGETDPEIGYRVEYSVSARYSKTLVPKLDSQASGRSYSFIPKPPPQLLNWINTHILRRPARPSQIGYRGLEPGTIDFFYFTRPVPSEVTVDTQGYPHLTSASFLAPAEAEQRLLVSGCPATWCAFNVPMSTVLKLRLHLLLIKPRDQPTIYAFTAADNAYMSTGATRELLRIRDSIRIFKSR